MGLWSLTLWIFKFVISRSELPVCDWSYACHVMCKNNVAWFCQCSVMFPGNMASRVPCSQGTWCKPRDTMHLRRYFGSTTVLGRSIHILCCCVMDDDTSFLHLFRDITKQMLTVSLNQRLTLGQHCSTSGHYFSMLPSAPVNICIMLNDTVSLISYILECCFANGVA